MSSLPDVMDEDTRQAVHKALDDVARPDVRSKDVYAREAEAWLVAGMSRREAVSRVKAELALTQTKPGLDANCVTFSIDQSTRHGHLALYFSGDALSHYNFIPINGQPTD